MIREVRRGEHHEAVEERRNGSSAACHAAVPQLECATVAVLVVVVQVYEDVNSPIELVSPLESVEIGVYPQASSSLVDGV